MKEGAVVDISTAGGVNERAGRERRLVKGFTCRDPDMAATNAVCDHNQPRWRVKKPGGHDCQIAAARAFFRKVPRYDAQVARLEQVPNGLAETPGTAIERDLSALRQGVPDGGAGGVLMAAIDVEQPCA